eukprot:4599611-Prymnesium_polylepis.1
MNLPPAHQAGHPIRRRGRPRRAEAGRRAARARCSGSAGDAVRKAEGLARAPGTHSSVLITSWSLTTRSPRDS